MKNWAVQGSMNPASVGAMIHEGMTIVEAEKYADENTCFMFVFTGATDDDVAEVRQHLTPFENRIIDIRAA